MNLIADRLQALILKSGLSYKDLETMTGIPKSTIQRYAKGSSSKIPMTAIDALAKALDETPEYLMGWPEKKEAVPDIGDGLTPAQKYFIENIGRLTPDQQELLAAQIKVLLEKQK